MSEEKEIDLFAVFVWKIKSLYKNAFILLIGIVLGTATGFYKHNKNKPVTLKEKVFIFKSNLPQAGAMYKLSSSFLQETSGALKGLLKIDQTVLQNINSVSLDTSFKPMLLLKVSGNNEDAINNLETSFVGFYNTMVKSDVLFELERCEKIIDRFNFKTNGELLKETTVATNSITQSIHDGYQLEAYEKGLEYIKRKKSLEKDGALSLLNSSIQDVQIGASNLTKTVIIYALIGFIASALIALIKEGWILLKPLLK